MAPYKIELLYSRQRIDGWSSYNTLAKKLGTAAKALSTGEAFDIFKSSGGISPTSGRELLTATASAQATRGAYSVEVAGLARAEKLAGAVVSDPSADLALGGTFYLNGAPITVASGDSLNTVRDKINAANASTTPSGTPTGVSATILMTGTGEHRLVLSAEDPGTQGIELVDSTSTGGVLEGLGVLDGSQRGNVAADGRAQTQRFSSSDMAIAVMMGIDPPPPSTTSITVGGQTITIDLNTDSLAAIASRIAAAGGTVEVLEEDVGSQTMYRMRVDGGVATDPTDSYSQRAIELLGFVEGGRGSEQQTLRTGNALLVGGSPATTTATLTALDGGGAAGDTFVLRGTRTDGRAWIPLSRWEATRSPIFFRRSKAPSAPRNARSPQPWM